MKTKEKLLLVGILVVVAAIGILFSYFCGGAVHAFEHFVACSFASAPGLAKFSAGFFGV